MMCFYFSRLLPVRCHISRPQAHEVLCLEMLTLLLERPTDDSVEVAIAFLKECGLKLTEVSPRGINGIFLLVRDGENEGLPILVLPLSHFYLWTSRI